MSMNNDKNLYKLLGGALLFPIAVAGLAGGIKAAAFASWIVFLICIFGAIVVFSITSPGTASSSKNFIIRAVGGLFSFYTYRFFLGLLAVLMAFLSSSVWEYLDKRFPARTEKSLPVSEIYNPGDKW
ncbi:MAG: hypothetical protein HYU57_05690 [Micavibrio aeruginosavorus]|nr:hypothetical protein [Micavibrio aeruginosavorus]